MQDLRIPQCFVCMDTGFVLYQKIINGVPHEYAAYCVCEKGIEYIYNGKSCKKQSEYYIPCISAVADHNEIAEQNFHEWYKLAKNKPLVLQFLRQRAFGKHTHQKDEIPKEIAENQSLEEDDQLDEEAGE